MGSYERSSFIDRLLRTGDSNNRDLFRPFLHVVTCVWQWILLLSQYMFEAPPMRAPFLTPQDHCGGGGKGWVHEQTMG